MTKVFVIPEHWWWPLRLPLRHYTGCEIVRISEKTVNRNHYEHNILLKPVSFILKCKTDPCLTSDFTPIEQKLAIRGEA